MLLRKSEINSYVDGVCTICRYHPEWKLGFQFLWNQTKNCCERVEGIQAHPKLWLDRTDFYISNHPCSKKRINGFDYCFFFSQTQTICLPNVSQHLWALLELSCVLSPPSPASRTRMNRLIVSATLLNSLPVSCGNPRCVMCLRIMLWGLKLKQTLTFVPTPWSSWASLFLFLFISITCRLVN